MTDPSKKFSMIIIAIIIIDLVDLGDVIKTAMKSGPRLTDTHTRAQIGLCFIYR